MYSFTINKFKAGKSGTNTDNVPDNIKNKKPGANNSLKDCRNLSHQILQMIWSSRLKKPRITCIQKLKSSKPRKAV